MKFSFFLLIFSVVNLFNVINLRKYFPSKYLGFLNNMVIKPIKIISIESIL